MWLQAVAIALPRVQVHYAVPSSQIGYLSASTFLGMMLGAVRAFSNRATLSLTLHSFCGELVSGAPSSHTLALTRRYSVSDIFGRVTIFNLTLSFSALFGFFAFYVDTFLSLCFANFLLGTAVGVSLEPCPPLHILIVAKGSMPTDGTFALETLPRAKRHLLTSLSVVSIFYLN